MTEAERSEYDALNAKVWKRDPQSGNYLRWSDPERDRWRELTRKRYPGIQFAPSTAEMARRFGHLARERAR